MNNDDNNDSNQPRYEHNEVGIVTLFQSTFSRPQWISLCTRYTVGETQLFRWRTIIRHTRPILKFTLFCEYLFASLHFRHNLA